MFVLNVAQEFMSAGVVWSVIFVHHFLKALARPSLPPVSVGIFREKLRHHGKNAVMYHLNFGCNLLVHLCGHLDEVLSLCLGSCVLLLLLFFHWHHLSNFLFTSPSFLFFNFFFSFIYRPEGKGARCTSSGAATAERRSFTENSCWGRSRRSG